MDKLSYRRHRYPSIVIQQAIWLYFRFALSYRDVEDMLAERGIDVSYETVQSSLPPASRRIRRKRHRPDRAGFAGHLLIDQAAAQVRHGEFHARSRLKDKPRANLRLNWRWRLSDP